LATFSQYFAIYVRAMLGMATVASMLELTNQVLFSAMRISEAKAKEGMKRIHILLIFSMALIFALSMV